MTKQSIKNTLEFNGKVRPNWKVYNEKKRNTIKSINVLYDGQELIINALMEYFQSKY